MRLIFGSLFLLLTVFFSSIELSSQSGKYPSRQSGQSTHKSTNIQSGSRSGQEIEHSEPSRSIAKSESGRYSQESDQSSSSYIRGSPGPSKRSDSRLLNRQRRPEVRKTVSALPERLYSTNGSIPSYAYFGHPGAPVFYNRQPESPPRSHTPPSPRSPQSPPSPNSSTGSNPPHYHLDLNN